MITLYGGPVSGNNRFPRPPLEEEALRLVIGGAGLKMFGLRRTGKSTMRLFIAEQMEARGCRVIFIDAQGMRSIDKLLFDMLAALRRRDDGLFKKIQTALSGGMVPGVVASLIRQFGKGKALADGDSQAIAAYWPILSNRIVEVLRKEQYHLLVIIDELPFLLQNMITDSPLKGAAEVDQLLAALREWREAGVKMVLAGSIGIAGLARKHGFRADHLNDLSALDVPELDEAEARAFIAAAEGKGPDWSETHTDALLHEVGAFYPSFLVKSLQALPSGTAVVDFAGIFAREIRPQLHETFYQQFDRRFKFYAEIDRDLHRKLILPLLAAILSQDEETAELPMVEGYDPIDRREVLAMLVEDGFVRYSEDAGGTRVWRPASRLARLWWRQSGL